MRLARTRLHHELIHFSELKPDCSALNHVKVYNSSVKSHTFRRAPQGRRFLCRKTYIPPASYNDTSVAKSVESFAGLERRGSDD
jgi:hypothetical protein